MQLSTKEEAERIESLLSLGSGKTEREIRNLLAEHKWNLDAAAGALFDSSESIITIHSGSSNVQHNTNTEGWGSESGWGDSVPQSTLAWGLDTELQPLLSDTGHAPRQNTPVPDAEHELRGRSKERTGENGALNARLSSNKLALHSSDSQKRNDVIDLTSIDDDNDEDMKKAMALSLSEQSQDTSGTTFGPSNRAPSVHWAMVPANAPIGPANADQEFDRALQMSLHEAAQEDVYEELPPEQQIRQGGRPVALRAPQLDSTYLCLMVQAYYHIPQVRSLLSKFRNEPGIKVPLYDETDIEELLTLAERIQSAFTYMHLAQTSYHTIGSNWFGQHGEMRGDSLADRVTFAHDSFSFSLEQLRFVQSENDSVKQRLFHLREAKPGADWEREPPELTPILDHSTVRVDWNPSSLQACELLSCLETFAMIEYPLSRPPQRRLIQLPPDVLTIPIHRREIQTVTNHPFKFPSRFYLDRFLASKKEVIEQKREMQSNIGEDIQRLESETIRLTTHEGSDILESLKASVYYLEEVTESRNDPALAGENQKAASKLRRVIEQIESRVKTIQELLQVRRAEIGKLFESPDTQEYRYDLRAVLYHDGLLGRDHVYSYVMDPQTGVWWKSVDHTVTEVTEEAVLEDNAGLQIGGGPFCLFYSRTTKPGDPAYTVMPWDWPEKQKEDILSVNATLRERLPPEIAAELEASELQSQRPDAGDVGSQMSVDTN